MDSGTDFIQRLRFCSHCGGIFLLTGDASSHVAFFVSFSGKQTAAFFPCMHMEVNI